MNAAEIWKVLLQKQRLDRDNVPQSAKVFVEITEYEWQYISVLRLSIKLTRINNLQSQCCRIVRHEQISPSLRNV